jgi:hypothetical protein
MPDYASDESDLDLDFDSSKNAETADINDIPTYESSSDDEQPDSDSSAIQSQEESPAPLTRPSRARQQVQHFKTTHTPRPPRSQTPSEILWNTDPSHKKERLSWIGKEVNNSSLYMVPSEAKFNNITMPLTITLLPTKTTMLNTFPTSA